MIKMPKLLCLADRYPWLRVYLTLVGVGMICSFVIATTYETTRHLIARNRSDALRLAVLDVLPGTISTAAFQCDENGEFAKVDQPTGGGGGDYFVAGYDDQGQLIGVAIEASGYGYQDIIRLLYGYSPDRDTVIGFQVLESRETPGLGDRVAVDKRFHAQIASLDVALDRSGDAVLNPIVFVAGRARSSPWEVDGVTGATVTSRAITNILSESTSHWAPRIKRQVEQFRYSGKEGFDAN